MLAKYRCSADTGGSIEELKNVAADAWLRDVERAFEKMLGVSGRKRFICGLSFGGLLALHLAEKYPEKVDALAILSPPFVLRDSVSEFLLKVFSLFPESFLDRLGTVAKTKRDPSVLSEKHFTFPYHSIAAGARLMQVKKSVFANLDKITCPVLLLQDPREHQISSRGIDAFVGGAFNSDVSVVWVTGGEHELTLGHKKEEVFDRISHFFTENVEEEEVELRVPREIVHWQVLECAIEELRDSAAGPALSRNRDAAYLGSIAHDAPYYYKLGRDEFEEVSELLHGANGEDTYLPIKSGLQVLPSFPEEQREMLWCFLMGMFSHCASDIAFHPLVYYLTGNYYAKEAGPQKKARTQHRLFEVLLDQCFLAEKTSVRKTSISSVFSSIEPQNVKSICKLLESVCGMRTCADKWQESFSTMASLQTAFNSKPIGFLFRLANRASSGKLSSLDALFAYGRTKNDWSLSKQVSL